MKESKRSFLSATMSMLLVGGIWAFPAFRAHQAAIRTTSDSGARLQEGAKTISVSGKIASFKGNKFTLEVQQNDGDVDAMTFTTDQNSKVDGKLANGATVDVTYRVDNGENIVISAHVSPPPNPNR